MYVIILSISDILFIILDIYVLVSAGCESPKSCLNANIKATNVHEFSCGGGSACENATIRIAGEQYKGVGFSCGSGEACYNASIIVKKTGSFSCGGGKACLDSNIYIEPLDEGFVLSCGSAGVKCVFILYKQNKKRYIYSN